MHLTRRNILQDRTLHDCKCNWEIIFQARAETYENYPDVCYPALPGRGSMRPQMFMLSQHHCVSLSPPWKLLSPVCTLKTLNCAVWGAGISRTLSLLLRAEVIGSAITPAFLTNSWRPREVLAQLSASPAESSDTLSVSSALESREAPRLQKRQSSELASLPTWMPEELDLEKQMTMWGHVKIKPLKIPAKAVTEPASRGIFTWARALRSAIWSSQHSAL